jgi:DNA excision repair protein ERCC-4
MPRTHREKPLLCWIVDTREQYPYQFKSPRRDLFEDGGTLGYALGESDYSVEKDGVLLPIRIERKSLSDYYGIIGKGRERFERELQRLRPFRSYLVIEATPEQVRAGYERSLVSGEAAFWSAWGWSIQYGIMPVFAGNRTRAREITQWLLEDFAKHHNSNGG